jgi:holliday junction DNA helicase RuvA
MIAHLTGTFAAVAPDGAVLEVGGVGLQVQCAPGTLAGLRLGEQARVATSLVVREDSLTLYGFASDDERNTFELLQTASGVGPRLALAMLAVLTPDALRRAVAAEDLAVLTSVPGIGRKGAQRIVLELAGRLGSPGDGQLAAAAGPVRVAAIAPWRDQVRAGLVSLGWQAREADQAIAAVEPELLAASGASASASAAGASGAGASGAGASAAGASGAGASGAGASGDDVNGASVSGADDAESSVQAAPAIDVAVALRAALRVLGRP